MIWIRIFRTKEEAEWAKKILVNAGIHAEIQHDKFVDTPIEKYGVPARFRLMIFPYDLDRAARFLSKKLEDRTKD